MKFWFDITNTPQVHFLLSLYNSLKEETPGNEYVFTAREFSETTKLLKKQLDTSFSVLGKHYGKSKTNKAFGLLSRFNTVIFSKIDFDVSISCGSENAVWASAIKRKKSIAFGDNDQARQWTYGHFVDFAFFPDAINASLLSKQGIKKHKLYLYPGLKEDIYVADYKPDQNFKKTLPFDHYVVVRPENIMANYIRNDKARSITPNLLKKLSERGVNILYLPRYETDYGYAKGIPNLFIPDNPINGLDACYFSDAVLTGAGTFAREAACLGVPSFSFYAGSDLLSVDKKLIKEGRMFFSRDATELTNQVVVSKRKKGGLEQSKEVKKDVVNKLNEVISGF